MKMNLLCSMLIFGSFLSALAHEGHDHDAPKALRAPKGGLIQALEESRVEVVTSGANLKIYFYDKEMKPLPSATFKVAAETQKPRETKSEKLMLTEKEGHLEAKFDAKGVHRYSLILFVVDSRVGHNDKMTFTIEPKK